MSLMGQARPINDVCAMSAFYPIATKWTVLKTWSIGST